MHLANTHHHWPPLYAQGIKAASSKLGGLDGITTFCEMAVPLVARLAEKLGLPTNSPDGVDAARDKVRCRRRLQRPQLSCALKHLSEASASCGMHLND